METKDLLNIFLILIALAITICIVFITYFLIRVLKAINNLANNLEEATRDINGLKNSLQVKALAAIPAILATVLAKFLKRR